MILAIDPGPTQSAWLMLMKGLPIGKGIDPNAEVRSLVNSWKDDSECRLVIELVESYGMPVGADVFQTCVWIGRFDPDETATLIGRGQVKMHLCHTMKAKDSNIRQALIDRYGPGKDKAIGKKASPGPLYGLKSHLWAALALGVTYYDQTKGGNS